jgi:TRAP-type C4-dicarboxylate transport system permease small subunit
VESFIRFCDRLSLYGGVLSGVLTIVALVLVCAEMVIRTMFAKTLYITEEYTGYLMAALTFLALAYTLRDKSHIRMVFLHEVLKGRARTMVDIYAFAVGFVFCAVLTYNCADFFLDSIRTGSRSMQISATPLAIPHFFMPLGSLILTLQFAAEFCRSLLRLRTGETGEAESSTLGR